MLPGAARFGFGVPGSRTRVQDWKSSILARPLLLTYSRRVLRNGGDFPLTLSNSATDAIAWILEATQLTVHIKPA